MERNDRLWDASDPTDAATTEWSAAPAAPAPVRIGGGRRGLATAVLAAGLLVIGGVAAVSAADSSASPAPDATSQPANPGSSAQPDDNSGHERGDCPEDGSNGSGGSDGTDDGTDNSPDASPNASDSDL